MRLKFSKLSGYIFYGKQLKLTYGFSTAKEDDYKLRYLGLGTPKYCNENVLQICIEILKTGG